MAVEKIIPLAGRLDTSRVGEIETAFYAHVGAAKGKDDVVVIDLAELQFVSSLGLRMLLMAGKMLAQREASVGMVSPVSENVVETLKISGLAELFRFFPSADAALGALRSPPDATIRR